MNHINELEDAVEDFVDVVDVFIDLPRAKLARAIDELDPAERLVFAQQLRDLSDHVTCLADELESSVPVVAAAGGRQ